MASRIELGDRVRDRISGYEGLVVAITDWMFGCRRPMVQATTLTSDGKPVELQSFDEPTLEILEKAVMAPLRPSDEVVLEAAPALRRTGGPQPTPSRRPAPQR